MPQRCQLANFTRDWPCQFIEGKCQIFQFGEESKFCGDGVRKVAVTKLKYVLQICQQRFKDFQFGLKLMEKNTGVGKFELGEEAVLDADKFLSERVVRSYNAGTDDAEADQEEDRLR